MASDIVLDGEEMDIVGRFVWLKLDKNQPDHGSFAPGAGNLALGGNGQDGDIILHDGESPRVHLSGGGGTMDEEHVRIYLDGVSGDITLVPSDGSEAIGSLVGKIRDLERRIAELEE